MRFFILGNEDRPEVGEYARILRSSLEHCGGTVVLTDLAREKDLSRESADIALVLGGDGAMLRAARHMGYSQTPALGVNLGRLGFLADLGTDELLSCLIEILKGEYQISEHVMFEWHIDGLENNLPMLGLNEVVIRSGPPFHMIDLELAIDGETVTRFLGDGLIVSTPVGSTGHSLSAGGPILGQSLAAFVITPICGHTLTNRPLVESVDRTYTITVRHSGGGWLVVDGQELHQLNPNEKVTVRRAPVAFRLVRVSGKSYFKTLREKLRWGTTPNYRTTPGPMA